MATTMCRPGAVVDPDARLEDIEFMAATGETWEGIARRLGLRQDSLARWLHRAGRNDLAQQAERKGLS
jgi:hypothetical protein